jgi:hypothetical protein
MIFLDRVDPPVPGAARRQAPAPLQARNDATGEWKLTGVAAGQYQLRYESDQWVCPANAFITVAEGETLTRNEIVRPAASLTTIAVDQFGEPIPALDVTIFDEAGARVNAKADTPTTKDRSERPGEPVENPRRAREDPVRPPRLQGDVRRRCSPHAGRES